MEFEVKKSCHNCASLSSCKYVQDASDLFSSNKFYGMFQYLEWNHLLKNFKDTSAKMCMHYRRTFKDGDIDIESLPVDIMKDASNAYLKQQEIKYSSLSLGSKGLSNDMVYNLIDGSTLPIIEVAKNITLKLV